MSVMTEIYNRGVRDIFSVCDGVKGMPDSVDAVFPVSLVQTYIIHVIRCRFRFASKRHWDQIAHDLRPIYTAPSAQAAWAAFEEFEPKTATGLPAISGLWRDSFRQFIPFLD